MTASPHQAGQQVIVRPRIQSGPINASILAAIVFAALAYRIWPGWSGDGVAVFFGGLFSLMSGAFAGRAVRLLVRDYRLRRDLAISARITRDHGSARQSTYGERRARGMTDFRSGELLGLDENGRPIYRPESAPFALIEMPPGVGKTISIVIGSILHRAMLGYSMIIPDVKNELSVMLVDAFARLGVEMWSANPSGRYRDRIGNTPLNPYQPLIDAIHGDPDERKDAVKMASDYAVIHHPLVNDEKNPYFAYGSQRVLRVGMLSEALLDPGNCTPTSLYSLITDPQAFLDRCNLIINLESGNPPDPVVTTLKLEAANLLHREEHNDENFASFLEGAGQKLISFSPAGHLADYGAGAIHNIAAMRERQIALFITTPLSHLREFADFISLTNHNLIAACKAKPGGRPIHIVGEEALNYRFHDLVADLETLRGLRVTADFYIQSFAGLERQYGREAAAAIESYSDIRIYAGLNSLARARHVSDMLAEETIRKQETSYQTSVEKIGLSSREMGRPLMKPDEVLSMPRDQGWLFVRGLRPTRLHLINYAEVAPWCDWVGESPIRGTRLRAPRPRLSIRYPNR